MPCENCPISRERDLLTKMFDGSSQFQPYGNNQPNSSCGKRPTKFVLIAPSIEREWTSSLGWHRFPGISRATAYRSGARSRFDLHPETSNASVRSGWHSNLLSKHGPTGSQSLVLVINGSIINDATRRRETFVTHPTPSSIVLFSSLNSIYWPRRCSCHQSSLRISPWSWHSVHRSGLWGRDGGYHRTWIGQ